MVYFKPFKEKLRQYRIYGFDTETIGETNKFYLGTIYGKDIQKIFYSEEEMIEFLNHRKFKNKTFIVATNLQFDILSLFRNYMNLIQPLFRDSQMITATLKDNNNKKTIFLDTFNFVPLGVKKLGQIIKIPKLKKPKFLGQIPKTTEQINELSTYCMRDSEISCKFIEFLQEGYNTELDTNIKFTVASTSIRLFKNNFLKIPIKQPKIELLKKFYNAYYGGRTETFKRGNIKNCFYYDINSLYPNVMTKEYPNPNYMKTATSCKNIINDYEGISEIEIKIPKDYTFLLPYKQQQKIGKKLIFPIGKINGMFTHAEIRKALEYNAKILNYGKTIFYTKTFKPFNDYVNKLYKKRMEYKQQKNPIEILYKLSLNSLYGKFAQKIDKKQEIIHADNMTMEKLREISEQDIECIQIGDYFYITRKQLDINNIPSFINPIFSIYTTAYARILMFEKLQKLNDNYCYMDTDSIITDKKINTSLRLGEFKKEYDIKEGTIIKPKMYGFIGKNEQNKEVEIIRCKGLPIKNDYDKFMNFLKTRKARYIKFAKFKESIRSKEEYKHGKILFNQIIKVIKKYDLEDTKRIWKEKFNPDELQDSKPINL